MLGDALFACLWTTNNHEKMEIISMVCCKPLCPKGFRTKGNRLCENSRKKAVKLKKNKRIMVNGACFRDSFHNVKIWKVEISTLHAATGKRS